MFDCYIVPYIICIHAKSRYKPLFEYFSIILKIPVPLHTLQNNLFVARCIYKYTYNVVIVSIILYF